MNLGNFLAQIKKDKNSQQKKKTLFALRIDEENVQACLWLVENEETHVLAIGHQESWGKEEELLAAVDASLSSIDQFPGQAERILLEPGEIILGLPSSWIEADKIISFRLKLLKKIFHSLDLKPIGFVATPEAISHFFKAEEGVPLSGILVELKSKKLCLTLVSLGKTKAYEEVIRSRALQEDLLEGLFRLKEENSFPARVLIFGSKEAQLEDLRQKLVDYPWVDSGINFLHLPKVDLLPFDLPIKAVALAGGRETAGTKTLGLSLESGVDNVKREEQEEPLPDDKVGKMEETESLVEEAVLSDNLGVLTTDLERELELGFVKNDINLSIATTENEQDDQNDLMSALPEPETVPTRQSIWNKFFVFFSALPRFWASFLPKPALFQGSFFTPRLFLVFFLLLLVFIGAGAALWFLPKATVTLHLEPKTSQADFLVQIDGQSDDSEILNLPGQSVSAELSGNKSQSTTGTKLVGEKAIGKVAIFNRTSQDKTFNQGTVLVGPDGLEFTLDEEVTVASQSAGEDYSLLPGKAEAQITAVEIGTEGNLANKTEFAMANFARSDFIARNEEAFGGGSSREVQAVAQQDLDDLKDSLTEELKDKAISELRSQIVGQKELLEDSISAKVADQQFDSQLGEQAQEVTLDLTINFSGLVFSQQELKELADSQLKTSVPQDYVRLEEKDQFSFELKDPDNLVFQVILKTTLIPKLDLSQIKKDLVGKKVSLGQSYLLSLSGVKMIDLAFYPRLPSWLLTFPRVSKNITIETTVDQ